MKRKIKVGTTSHIEQIVIDDSSSAIGAGLASLLYNSAGLTAKYKRVGDAGWTTITLTTATAGTWTSGGFIESDSGAGGGYELHIPDAALATGASAVWVEVYGATDAAPVRIEYELDAIDYQSSVQDEATASLNAYDPPTNAQMEARTLLATSYSTFNAAADTVTVASIAADAITAAATAPDFGTELAAAVEVAIVNDADTTAVLQAVADKIATDWIAGDASPLAVAAAVRTNLAVELARIDATISSRSTITPAEVNSEVLDVLSVDTLVDGKTLAESQQIISAVVAGKISGAGTGVETCVGLDGVTVRIVANVDNSGNRPAMTYL